MKTFLVEVCLCLVLLQSARSYLNENQDENRIDKLHVGVQIDPYLDHFNKLRALYNNKLPREDQQDLTENSPNNLESFKSCIFKETSDDLEKLLGKLLKKSNEEIFNSIKRKSLNQTLEENELNAHDFNEATNGNVLKSPFFAKLSHAQNNNNQPMVQDLYAQSNDNVLVSPFFAKLSQNRNNEPMVQDPYAQSNNNQPSVQKPTRITRQSFSGPESPDNWSKCVLRSELQEHALMENMHIASISQEIKKLQQLVRLLQDQQYILNILNDFDKKPKQEDINDQQQLIRLLQLLKNNIPRENGLDNNLVAQGKSENLDVISLEKPKPKINQKFIQNEIPVENHENITHLVNELNQLKHLIVNKSLQEVQNKNEGEKLQHELENQKKQLQDLKRRIENLKTLEPEPMKDDNKTNSKMRQAEGENQIERIQQELQDLETKLSEFMSTHPSNNEPPSNIVGASLSNQPHTPDVLDKPTPKSKNWKPKPFARKSEDEDDLENLLNQLNQDKPRPKATSKADFEELQKEIDNLTQLKGKTPNLANPRANEEEFMENLQRLLADSESNAEAKEIPFDLSDNAAPDLENRLSTLQKRMEVLKKIQKLEKKVKQLHDSDEAESKSIDDEGSIQKQLKKMMSEIKKLNKDQIEGKDADDIQQEFKNLQAEINNLKPSEADDEQSFGKIGHGSTDVQIMLNKFLQKGPTAQIGPPVHGLHLSPLQIQLLKRKLIQMRQGHSTHFGQFETPQGPGSAGGTGPYGSAGGQYEHAGGFYGAGPAQYGTAGRQYGYGNGGGPYGGSPYGSGGLAPYGSVNGKYGGSGGKYKSGGGPQYASSTGKYGATTSQYGSSHHGSSSNQYMNMLHSIFDTQYGSGNGQYGAGSGKYGDGLGGASLYGPGGGAFYGSGYGAGGVPYGTGDALYGAGTSGALYGPGGGAGLYGPDSGSYGYGDISHGSGSKPYGAGGGTYGSGDGAAAYGPGGGAYGSAGETYGSGSAPYGSGIGAYGSENTAYGSGSGAYASSGGAYGSAGGAYGAEGGPYGPAGGTYGPGGAVYGSGIGAYGSESTSYGSGSGAYASGGGAYGSGGGAYGTGSGAYGPAGGTYGPGGAAYGSEIGAYGSGGTGYGSGSAAYASGGGAHGSGGGAYGAGGVPYGPAGGMYGPGGAAYGSEIGAYGSGGTGYGSGSGAYASAGGAHGSGGGAYGVGGGPYGPAGGTYGSGGAVYGSGIAAYGSQGAPYGSGSGVYGSSSGAYGSEAAVYGDYASGGGSGPHGSGNGPYGSGDVPYGSAAGQSSAAYGTGPYGAGELPHGPGDKPYGSGGVVYGSGSKPNSQYGVHDNYGSPPKTYGQSSGQYEANPNDKAYGTQNYGAKLEGGNGGSKYISKKQHGPYKKSGNQYSTAPYAPPPPIPEQTSYNQDNQAPNHPASNVQYSTSNVHGVFEQLAHNYPPKPQFFPDPGYGTADAENYKSTAIIDVPNSQQPYANPPHNPIIGDSYTQQKVSDLKTQIYGLENVINHLNGPDYIQKPGDQEVKRDLDQKIDDLKHMVSYISRDVPYSNAPGSDKTDYQQAGFRSEQTYNSDGGYGRGLAQTESTGDQQYSHSARRRRQVTPDNEEKTSKSADAIQDFFQQLSDIMGVINYYTQGLPGGNHTEEDSNSTQEILKPIPAQRQGRQVAADEVTNEVEDTLPDLFNRVTNLVNSVNELSKHVFENSFSCVKNKNCSNLNLKSAFQPNMSAIRRKRQTEELDEDDDNDDDTEGVWNVMAPLFTNMVDKDSSEETDDAEEMAIQNRNIIPTNHLLKPEVQHQNSPEKLQQRLQELKKQFQIKSHVEPSPTIV